MEEPRLADPGLAHHRDDLPMSGTGAVERAAELPQLGWSRPMKRLSPRARAAWSRERAGPAPISSYTSTGSARPLTDTGPNARARRSPRQGRRVAAVTRLAPGGRSCSIRAARWVV